LQWHAKFSRPISKAIAPSHINADVKLKESDDSLFLIVSHKPLQFDSQKRFSLKVSKDAMLSNSHFVGGRTHFGRPRGKLGFGRGG
jgi:hypothetical protein